MQDTSRPTHGGNLVWAASIAGCSPSAILDFSASISPLGPPESALAAIQESLGLLRDYPDPEYQTLRRALSQQHQLPMEWVLAGNGSAELLTWASRELAQLEATYLLTPAFGDYLRALNAFDAKVVRCQLQTQNHSVNRGDNINSNIVNRNIEGGRARWHFADEKFFQLQPPTANYGLLLNNPHNPTGRLFTIDAILPLLQQFALVVIDEAFMDFLPTDEQQSLIGAVADYPNLVILRSLTKFYSLAGLRLGYAVAHPSRLRRWQQWRDPWSVNTLAAAAGVAVLQDTQFQQQTWDWLKAARLHLFSELSRIPGLQPLPGRANFLLVHCQTSVVQLQRRLLEKHQILIRDCLSFPELGDQYFRVAVRTIEENQRLLEALRAEVEG